MNPLKFPASKRQLSLLALAAFATIGGNAIAQDVPGFYIGGSLGPTRAHFNNDAINSSFVGQGFTVNSSSVDNTSTGGKLFGGYQLNPNFAIEGGFFDLGRYNYSGTTSRGDYFGRSRVHGLNLDLVGTLPLSDRFSVLGRIGAAYARTADDIAGSGVVAPLINSNRKTNNTNVKFGVGLQYALTDALSLRAELERYRISDPIRNRNNIDMASIGVTYLFGGKVQTPVAQAYVAPPPPPAPVYVAPPPPPPPRVEAPAPVVVAPPPPPPPVYVPPARPAKEGRN